MCLTPKQITSRLGTSFLEIKNQRFSIFQKRKIGFLNFCESDILLLESQQNISKEKNLNEKQQIYDALFFLLSFVTQQKPLSLFTPPLLLFHQPWARGRSECNHTLGCGTRPTAGPPTRCRSSRDPTERRPCNNLRGASGRS